MAQIRNGDKAFLSKATEVKHLVEERGDIHHIFPKKYLQSNGFNNRNQYNQIANYVYTQQEINITIKYIKILYRIYRISESIKTLKF